MSTRLRVQGNPDAIEVVAVLAALGVPGRASAQRAPDAYRSWRAARRSALRTAVRDDAHVPPRAGAPNPQR